LIKVLAFLRSRLLTAVMFPGIIGIAYSGSRGIFPPAKVVLVLLGLAVAELISLLAVDYRTHWERTHSLPVSYPPLPGNPVFARILPSRLPQLMTLLGFIGVAVLGYFYFLRGPEILLLLAVASMAAFFYFFNPFPYSFLFILAVPPILTGAVHTALSGALEIGAFLVGLPSAFILAGINLIYRELYKPQEDFLPARILAVLLLFSLSLCSVTVLIILKILPLSANSVSILVLAGLYFSFQIFKKEQKSPIPAVLAGIGLYIMTALSVAVSLVV